MRSAAAICHHMRFRGHEFLLIDRAEESSKIQLSHQAAQQIFQILQKELVHQKIKICPEQTVVQISASQSTNWFTCLYRQRVTSQTSDETLQLAGSCGARRGLPPGERQCTE